MPDDETLVAKPARRPPQRREEAVAGVQTPRVSVLMPVYNGERFVGEAIESILAQSFDDWEFLIVDDGSTDSTPHLLRHYTRIDERIRVLTNKHSGIVKALNDGLAAASGELIARIDADDVALPHRLELQVAYLDSHPECLCVGSGIVRINADGVPIEAVHVPTDHKAIVQTILRRESAVWHPTVTYRRQAILDHGGYDPQFEWAEDLDLWLRLDESGGLANLDEPLLRYRRHDANVGVTRRSQQPMISDRIIAAYAERRGCPVPPAWRVGMSDRLRRRVWVSMETGRALTGMLWSVAAVCANPFKLLNHRSMYLAARRVIVGR